MGKLFSSSLVSHFLFQFTIFLVIFTSYWRFSYNKMQFPKVFEYYRFWVWKIVSYISAIWLFYEHLLSGCIQIQNLVYFINPGTKRWNKIIKICKWEVVLQNLHKQFWTYCSNLKYVGTSHWYFSFWSNVYHRYSSGRVPYMKFAFFQRYIFDNLKEK
jgi:hypothetical protein